MSKEEEDLREFAKVLEELAREAKTPSDLKSKLLSDASARLEDISARRTVEDREARSQRSGGLPRILIRYVATQWEALQRGPALSDPLARSVVDGLVNNRWITVKQRRLINLYQMIRFHASGSMSVVLASPKSYRLAAQVLSLLAILLMLSAIIVWEVVSQIDGALPIAYTLGALIGFLLRSAYDSAWGRDEIASCLCTHLPWLSVRNQE